MSLRGSAFLKRTRSTETLLDEDERKRLRRQSTMSIDGESFMSMPSPGPSRTPSRTPSRILRSQDGPIDREILSGSSGTYTRPVLSATASFTSSTPLSRSSSIDGESLQTQARYRKTPKQADETRMRRESLGPDGIPLFQQHSAFHVLRAVNSIDYSGVTGPALSNTTTTTTVTTAGTAPDPPAGAPPVAWTHSNALVFGRGVRVHYKNMADTDGVAGQLTKLGDSTGGLRLLAGAGADRPRLVALASHKGQVQLWELGARAPVAQWRLKGPSTLVFNGPLFSVGDERGGLRHYDTRIGDAAKMREQATQVTRHQGAISALAWYKDGVQYASGDRNGLVLVWDLRKPKFPLENVGEMVQRRRKMHHTGAITALAWCPWYGKYLVSGDSAPDGTGTLRIWDITNPEAPSAGAPDRPTRLEMDAAVTSVHFSAHINELLTTHGAGARTEVPSLSTSGAEPLRSRFANSIVVHQFPRMRNIRATAVASHSLAGSVLSPNGHRVAVAVPEEGQLKVWEVWGKFKEGPRQSFSSCTIR